MSLFENDQYQWRETYFVLFDEGRRPQAAAVERMLRDLSGHYEIHDLRCDEAGQFEAVTLISPDDYAAMDITYLEGEEVVEQVAELWTEVKKNSGGEDQERLSQIAQTNARFEVFHFEQLTFGGGNEEEDETMDPGALLIVLEHLADLVSGISVDPQSATLI